MVKPGGKKKTTHKIVKAHFSFHGLREQECIDCNVHKNFILWICVYLFPLCRYLEIETHLMYYSDFHAHTLQYLTWPLTDTVNQPNPNLLFVTNFIRRILLKPYHTSKIARRQKFFGWELKSSGVVHVIRWTRFAKFWQCQKFLIKISTCEECDHSKNLK